MSRRDYISTEALYIFPFDDYSIFLAIIILNTLYFWSVINIFIILKQQSAQKALQCKQIRGTIKLYICY